MTTKHTPGPWNTASLDQDSNHMEVFAGVGDGEQVAVIKGYELSSGKYYEAIANARLIAAAPELLEALKEAQQLLSNLWTPEVGKRNVWTSTHAAIDAAIAKATQG